MLDIHRSSRDLGTILVFLCGKDDVDTLVERLNDITDSDAQQLQATSRRYGELEVSPLYGGTIRRVLGRMLVGASLQSVWHCMNCCSVVPGL